MAHERIALNAALPMGQALLEAIDDLAEGKAQLERLREAKDKMIDAGPPASYAQLATEFGCAAGDAEALSNLITGAMVVLDTVNDLYSLITRTDQG